MRLWNSSPASARGSLVDGVPDDIRALLTHTARGYLPYLNANVEAVRRDDSHFTANVDGVTYQGARSSQYRVWCLDELRKRYRECEQSDSIELEQLLRETGMWDPLWAASDLPLLKDQESRLPFWGDSKMTKVNE